MRRFRTAIGGVILASAMLLAACGGGGASSGADLAALSKQGEMTLGADKLKVKTMDVTLVDPDAEDRYPETFVLHGPDMELAGSFPLDLRVGYEEKWEVLIGKSIKIESATEVPGEGEFQSHVTVGGQNKRVSEGTFELTRVLGHNPDGAGSVVEGKINLKFEGGGGAGGTFRCLARTWG